MRFRFATVCGVFAVAWVVCTNCLPVAADEPPDSQVNPLNCEIYTVSTGPSPDRPRDVNVEFTIDPGPGVARSTTQITSDARDDLAPKIAVAENGDAWVVWWRDLPVDRVLLRGREFSTESWTDEVSVSRADAASRNPEIIFDGERPWVVYEFEREPCGTGIMVVDLCRVIHDEPDPVNSRHVVDETDWDGNVDARIHSEVGAVWITWVYDESLVGWSLYDGATWSPPAYVPYGDWSIDEAREWIRYIIMESP
jgi:hypothetical protein